MNIVFPQTENAGEIKGDRSDEIGREMKTVVITGRAILKKNSFEYHEKVDVTVTECIFQGAVEFIFHDNASIKFVGNKFGESVYIEGYGKLQIEFKKCTISGTKEVFFHQDSTLKCKGNSFYGSALYKGYAELHVNFRDCYFFESKRCIAAKLIVKSDIKSDDCRRGFHQYKSRDQENRTVEKKTICVKEISSTKIDTDPTNSIDVPKSSSNKFDMKCFFKSLIVTTFVLVFVLCADYIIKGKFGNENSILIDEISQFKINSEMFYSQKTYNFDEKVDAIVNCSTFIDNVKFHFNKDANLTFIGSICMGSIAIETHGKLNIVIQKTISSGKANISIEKTYLPSQLNRCKFIKLNENHLGIVCTV